MRPRQKSASRETHFPMILINSFVKCLRSMKWLHLFVIASVKNVSETDSRGKLFPFRFSAGPTPLPRRSTVRTPNSRSRCRKTLEGSEERDLFGERPYNGKSSSAFRKSLKPTEFNSFSDCFPPSAPFFSSPRGKLFFLAVVYNSSRRTSPGRSATPDPIQEDSIPSQHSFPHSFSGRNPQNDPSLSVRREFHL